MVYREKTLSRHEKILLIWEVPGKKKIMKAIVKTKNGMNLEQTFEVKSISVWYDKVCNHTVNEISISELLKEVKSSNMMTYDPKGSIDAFDSTPLYSNGQKNVVEFIVDGVTVWKK